MAGSFDDLPEHLPLALINLAVVINIYLVEKFDCGEFAELGVPVLQGLILIDLL